MVDDRRAAILRAIVQQFIETSQPVSSAHVAKVGGVNASAATIRSEMAALEREGFLKQPHTSAGRIPTDHGYRYFVDQLGVAPRLATPDQQGVKEFFAKATGQIERMLHETGRLLSNLTGATAVVVGPEQEAATIRSAQLVSLSSKLAMVVLVYSSGSVERATLELEEEVSDAVVAAASVQLNKTLLGTTGAGRLPVAPSGDANVDKLVDMAIRSLDSSESSNRVFVEGASRVAESFEAVETVRSVLSILEQQYVVVTLIRDLLDRGVTVSIGSENNLKPLAQCSLVVAPTIVDGEQRGSVAVLGPTRMNYSQALAAVTVVSRSLGERLSDGQV